MGKKIDRAFKHPDRFRTVAYRKRKRVAFVASGRIVFAFSNGRTHAGVACRPLFVFSHKDGRRSALLLFVRSLFAAFPVHFRLIQNPFFDALLDDPRIDAPFFQIRVYRFVVMRLLWQQQFFLRFRLWNTAMAL